MKEKQIKLGPTGEGIGALGPDDKGSLYARIVIRRNRIIIEFGTELSYIAMTKSEAQSFAMGLLAYAGRLQDEEEE